MATLAEAPTGAVNGDGVDSEIRCLDDPPAQIREEEDEMGATVASGTAKEQEAAAEQLR